MISPLTPSLAMNLVPYSFVYLSLSVSWSILTVAIVPTLAIRDQVPCTASIDPQHGVARQFDGESGHEVIRCSGRISKEHHFTHPVFDISFGQTPLKGIFILRGSSQCSSNKELCWSDFRIPRQALRQLLLPSVEANSIANGGDTSSASEVTHSSAISFTCNIADTSGNLTVRCLEYGTIRYANVLKYNERCSAAINASNECAQNMECAGKRCVCRQGFLPFELTREEVICVGKASLGQKCNFSRQCQLVSESLCEFDSVLGFKICKCLSGFEEVRSAGDAFHCAPVKPTQSTTTSTASADELERGASGQEKDNDDTEDVEILTETRNHAKDRDAIMGEKKDLQTLVLKLGKNNQIGLIVFGGVILAVILLVAIIIRVRNHGKLNVEKIIVKGNSSGNSKRCNSKDGPLLGVVHRLTGDEEEDEVDVRIDEHPEDVTGGGQLIYNDEDSQETNVDGQWNRLDSRSEPYQDTTTPATSSSSQAASNVSLSQAANFNYSAKQSVV